MIDLLIRKLDQLGPLSDIEKQALASVSLDTDTFRADSDLFRAGDRPRDCKLIVEGL